MFFVQFSFFFFVFVCLSVCLYFVHSRSRDSHYTPNFIINFLHSAQFSSLCVHDCVYVGVSVCSAMIVFVFYLCLLCCSFGNVLRQTSIIFQLNSNVKNQNRNVRNERVYINQCQCKRIMMRLVYLKCAASELLTNWTVHFCSSIFTNLLFLREWKKNSSHPISHAHARTHTNTHKCWVSECGCVCVFSFFQLKSIEGKR